MSNADLGAGWCVQNGVHARHTFEPNQNHTFSGIISDFIRRMARKHDLPEFAGVLSTIGANDLALKSMWCSTF